MIRVNLTNRISLVTGGSRGIGASISRCLARAGAMVWINHRPTSKSTEIAKNLVNEISKFDGSAREIGADVTKEDQVSDMVEAIRGKSKRVDILVCNAGSGTKRSLAELSSKEWESVQKLNLTHVFYTTKKVIPLMADSGGGNIILIGSTGVAYGGGGGVHYASSKAALKGFMLALEREYISKNIRVNIIHPSLVDTQLLRKRYSTQKARQKLMRRAPLGRLSQPDDIGYLTAFLVSDLASYICCQEIFVDGGLTIPF